MYSDPFVTTVNNHILRSLIAIEDEDLGTNLKYPKKNASAHNLNMGNEYLGIREYRNRPYQAKHTF
jgi:hypothetical protein